MIRPLLALFALLAVLILSACGDDSDSGGGESEQTATDVAVCAEVDQPAPREDGGATKPSRGLRPSKAYEVTFATSCGDFTVRLDVEQSPHTTASFAKLAEDGFYDGTTFHRIVPGFVIQGGDPTGSGMGGPGYQTIDEPPADARYVKGVVAMAKAASEPAGTGGSQFYVVTADDAGLPPEYAIVGKVVDGMGTVARIEELGSPSEQPVRPVVIESAKVSES